LPWIHAARARRLALAGTIAAFAALTGTANAALTVQPNAPALTFPASVTDAVGGVSLSLCMDNSGNCIETPAPNPTQPLSVPGNFTPDGEGFYMLADATVPNAGIGLARFGLEVAFLDQIAPGEGILFGRVRFRFGDLKPGTDYQVTHPYGVDVFTADSNGIINETSDVGCLATPNCDFAGATYTPITSFLRWDPTVAPAAPAGYVGNYAQTHKVIGSPNGTNFVRLEELNGAGLPVGVVGETSDFNLQGKLAGAAPAAAPFTIADVQSLDYASRQVGAATPAKNVTLANHGTAPLTVTGATIGGTDAGDFSVAGNDCASVAPGASCTIGVVFNPLATGNRNAVLSVASNDAATPLNIALKGVGTPATGAAPAPVIIQAPAQAPIVIQAPSNGPAVFKVSSMTVPFATKLRTIRSKGIAATITTPKGANVARIRLLKRGSRKAIATKTIALERSGRQTIHLRAKKAKVGRYIVEISLGANAGSLSKGVTRALTIRR